MRGPLALVVSTTYNKENRLFPPTMARHMKEQLSVFGLQVPTIERAVKKTGSKGSAVESLLQRIREANQRGMDTNKQVDESKKFVQNLQSKNLLDSLAAKKQLELEKYKPNAEMEGVMLKKTELLAGVKASAPDWLKGEAAKVEHSPLVAEFIARVGTLPPDLQDNPHILEREIIRMQASSTTAGTREQHLEVQAMTKTVWEHIVASPEYSDADDTSGTTLDLYKTDKLADVIDPGGKPKNPTLDELKAWKAGKIAKFQHDNLVSELTNYQARIDDGFVTPEDEQAKLIIWEDLLFEGKTQRLTQGALGKDFDSDDDRCTKYNSHEVRGYLAKIRERRTALRRAHEKVQAERFSRGREKQPPVPNRLYYPTYKAMGAIDNPFGFLGKEMAMVQKAFFDEGGPDSALYKQLEDQFTQLQEIYTGEGLFNLLEWDMTENNPEKWTAAEKQEFYANKQNLIDFCSQKLLPDVKTVMNHMRLSFLLSTTKDMGERGQDGKRIEDMAKAIGEPGVLQARQRYGGIMDRVVRHYLNPEHINEVLSASTGKISRHKPGETYRTVKSAVVARLREDAALFQDNWQAWYDERSNGPNGKLAVYFRKNQKPEDMNFESNVDRIVDEALMYYSVQVGENKNVLRRALTPREGALIDTGDPQHNFTSSWEEKLILMSKHWEFGQQKYFADEDPPNTLLYERLDGLTRARPEFEAAAKRESAKNWDKIMQLKQKVKSGERVDKIKKDDPLYEFVQKLQITYMVHPQRREVFDKENMNRFVRAMSKTDYEKQLRIHMGLPIYEATVDGSYEYAESGWRFENCILRGLRATGLYTEAQLNPESDEYILGETSGRGKARAWFVPNGRNPEGPGHVERDGYLKILNSNISHAPHIYAQIDAVVDGVDQFTNNPDFNWSKWEEVDQRFHQIETVREQRRLSKNNYFTGLSNEQTAAARSVFEKIPSKVGTKYALTFDEYLHMQKAIATKYLDGFNPNVEHKHWNGKDGGGDKIEKFAAMRFGRHMIHTISNDIPWFDIDIANVSTDKSGSDAGDAFSRYFTDNTTKATDAANAFLATYKLNRKEVDGSAMTHFEITKGINDMATASAGRCLVLMQEFLTKEEFDGVGAITRGDAFTSYEQRILGSDLSPARNRIQMRERMEEAAVDGNPNLQSPFYWAAAEKKLEVTNWDNALGSHHGLLARGLNNLDSFYEKDFRPRLPEGLARRMDKFIGNKSYHRLTHFLDKNIPSYVTLYRGKNLVIYAGLLIGLVIAAEAQQKKQQQHE